MKLLQHQRCDCAHCNATTEEFQHIQDCFNELLTLLYADELDRGNLMNALDQLSDAIDYGHSINFDQLKIGG